MVKDKEAEEEKKIKEMEEKIKMLEFRLEALQKTVYEKWPVLVLNADAKRLLDLQNVDKKDDIKRMADKLLKKEKAKNKDD